MTHERHSASMLPPDLADIEAYLQPDMNAPPPAPPALLARIVESSRSDVPSTPPHATAPSSIRRWWPLVAAAALTAVVLGRSWWSGGRTSTRLPEIGAVAAAAKRASVAGGEATAREELSGLLIPWPQTARAQVGDEIDRRYPLRASLAPQRLSRLHPERRVFLRVTRDASGQEIGRIRRVWVLDTSQINDTLSNWISLAFSDAGTPGTVTGVDSILFHVNSLVPWQRRVHHPGYERFYLIDVWHRLVHVADSAGLFRSAEIGEWSQRQRLWTAIPRVTSRKLSGRHPLTLSEAHLALLLRTVLLWPEWESTVAIPSPLDYIAPRFDGSVMGLRVSAIDTLDTAMGRHPAYRVTLDYGAAPDIWWISVETGELLRSVRTLSDPTRTEVTTLESVGPLPPRGSR